MRADRLALAFLAVAAPTVLVAFWVAGTAAEVTFALLAVAFPVALIVVGASRDGRLGPLRLPVLLLALILEGSVVGMLWARGRVEELPWVGGLPLGAAIQLYGMWLAPLALVALAYALTFDSFTLREEDLERFRRAITRAEEGGPAEDPVAPREAAAGRGGDEETDPDGGEG